MPGGRHLMCNVRKYKERNREGRWAKGSLSSEHMMQEACLLWIKLELNVPFCHRINLFLIPTLFRPRVKSRSSYTLDCWTALQQNGSVTMTLLRSVIKDSLLKFCSSLPFLPHFASIHPTSPLPWPGWSSLLLLTALHKCLKISKREGRESRGHKC